MDHLESSFASLDFCSDITDHSIECRVKDGLDRPLLQGLASIAATNPFHSRYCHRYHCRNHILPVLNITRVAGTGVETEKGNTADTASADRIEE